MFTQTRGTVCVWFGEVAGTAVMPAPVELHHCWDSLSGYVTHTHTSRVLAEYCDNLTQLPLSFSPFLSLENRSVLSSLALQEWDGVFTFQSAKANSSLSQCLARARSSRSFFNGILFNNGVVWWNVNTKPKTFCRFLKHKLFRHMHTLRLFIDSTPCWWLVSNFASLAWWLLLGGGTWLHPGY